MFVMIIDDLDVMGVPALSYAPGIVGVFVFAGVGVLVGARVALGFNVAVAGMGVAVTTITIVVDVIATVWVGTAVDTAVGVVHAANNKTRVPKTKIFLRCLNIKPPNF
jgi:hypothetical protein